MDIFKNACKDSYEISKLYVNFPLQDIFLEIPNKYVFQTYFRGAQKTIK